MSCALTWRARSPCLPAHPEQANPACSTSCYPTCSSRRKKSAGQQTKGKHTTVMRELYPLPGGGYVADTPGLKALALWDIEAEELDGYFPEMHSRVASCQFNNCTHVHEPGCAVLAARGSRANSPRALPVLPAHAVWRIRSRLHKRPGLLRQIQRNESGIIKRQGAFIAALSSPSIRDRPMV